jgi:hypothetical protein
VWGTDYAGNTTSQPFQWAFQPVTVWTPATLEDRLSTVEYLQDLITFAGEKIGNWVGGSWAGITADQLVVILAQKIVGISELPPKSSVLTSINELRVPVEVLREYMATYQAINVNPVTGLVQRYPKPIPPSFDGQKRYLWLAYETLLAGIGTSYTELREIRGAPPDGRQALADRLGVTLDPPTSTPGAQQSRHDQLDSITLDPPADSTAAAAFGLALQQLFSLPAVTRPFDPADVLHPWPEPASSSWYQWQYARQRSIWQSQSVTPPAPVAYVAVVDPDVITDGDIRRDTAMGTRVLNELWRPRNDQLIARAGALDKARTDAAAAAAATPGTVLNALLVTAYPDPLDPAHPAVDIEALHQADVQGADISSPLAAAGLDRAGFTYLVQLQQVAAAPAAMITNGEWADAIDVLVGAYRRQQYPSWVAEEQGRGQPQGNQQPAVVLSPDTFAAGPDPTHSPLRIDPRARRDWLSTLRARELQLQALGEGTTGLIASAEQTALPVLRDALLADITGEWWGRSDPAALADAGERLTATYYTDVLAAGTLATTRVEQAITSLQTLLQDLRARPGTQIIDPVDGVSQLGALGDDRYPGSSTPFGLIAGSFDQEWAWMGSFESWKAATTIFLFPESHLDPLKVTGLGCPSAQFQALTSDLFGTSGSDVTAALKKYLDGDPATGQKGMRDLSPAGPDLDYGPPVPDLQKMQDLCKSIEGSAPGLALEVFWAVPVLIAERLRADRRYQDALAWLQVAFPWDDPDAYNPGNPRSPFDWINTEATTPAQPPNLSLPPHWTDDLDPFALVSSFTTEFVRSPSRPYPYLRATLLAIAGCLIDWADNEFTLETDESIAHALDLYKTALNILSRNEFKPVDPDASDLRDVKLPIPLHTALHTRAPNQLTKIRQDCNIAGLHRSQAQYDGAAIRQPTPYHFKVLLARAQQLTQQATVFEGEFLSAMEKFATQALAEFDAQNAARLTTEQLKVHQAQMDQANDGVALAKAQNDKAANACTTLSQAIAAPPNIYEQQLFQNYDQIRTAQDIIAGGELMVGIGQGVATATSGATPWGMAGAAAGAALEMLGAGVKFEGQVALNEFTLSLQRNQLNASIENRRQEWRIQLASAVQDANVAAHQVDVAYDQVALVTAEQSVAKLQNDQALARLKLIRGQFNDAAFYKWLSDTLGGVYRYFLQQATAVARLAQSQLAFERAEAAQSFIRADYWQPATTPPAGSKGDVRGLTGAERLAEDIAKLDSYAFSTDTRRLNLSQTFSLTQLAPVEFLAFKSTGQITFSTPQALFDRDFPGHYQQLIRQVHLSVVALVPPSRGIRATLASSGISRIVTESDGMFGEVLLRRDPSVVGLTSPVDATGVFTLDLQPDMLLPFEGSAVDTTWELILPPAANPFDFRTISDVLITIDYTALQSFDYQAEVIRRLNANRAVQADLVLSLARDFPDQWYELNNPDPATLVGPRTATLTIRPADLPPNLDPASTPQTAQIAICLSGGQPLPPVAVTISRITGNTTLTGTQQTDPTGVASTRRGAGPWTQNLIGSDPAGAWTLTFQATQQELNAGQNPIPTLFSPGGLNDAILVISWSGASLPWS